MSWSFSIGHLFGSELRVHATFFLLLAWIGTSAWILAGPEAALLNVVFVLALFACVVAHEFGHALMARRFGVRTPDITLLPIGGMARLEKIPERPGQEIAVALAGPAVNIVIWVILTAFAGWDSGLEGLLRLEDSGQGFVQRLAAVNLFLAVFNMIPAFPMDGGRVLRAALAIPLDRVRATRIAALGGQILAFLLGYVGLISGNPILILIAVFVFFAAVAERSDVQLHDLARGYLARDAMITSFEALTPAETLSAAAAALIRTTQSEFPVIGADGSLAGFLTKSAIVEGAGRKALSETVGSALVGNTPTIRLHDPLERALEFLQQPEIPVVAVTDRRGNFVGYISRENIGEWAVLSQGRRG